MANSSQTTSIGDMLDMDFESEIDAFVERIGYDADEESWRVHDGEERSLAFDIIWTATGNYPPEIEGEPVVDAILDDSDHNYRVTLPDRETQVSPTGLALFAYLDDTADVEVVE